MAHSSRITRCILRSNAHRRARPRIPFRRSPRPNGTASQEPSDYSHQLDMLRLGASSTSSVESHKTTPRFLKRLGVCLQGSKKQSF